PWKTKSCHSFSVCKSPGPLVTFSQPSGVTENFDFARFSSPVYCFQGNRSLPLKMGWRPTGRTFNLRTLRVTPAGTVMANCVLAPDAASEPGEVRPLSGPVALP